MQINRANTHILIRRYTGIITDPTLCRNSAGILRRKEKTVLLLNYSEKSVLFLSYIDPLFPFYTFCQFVN